MEDDDAHLAGAQALAHAQSMDEDRELEDLSAEMPEEDSFDLELDGQVHTLPAALKGAFLRQADYTRKTQELAEHRRAVEAERQALSERSGAARAASRDRLRLEALDDQLEQFDGVDWQAYAAEDPQGAQGLWARFQELGEAREQLAYAVRHQEEREQLQAAREAAERMTETGSRLRDEIEGWSPEVASKLVDYAQAFGVTMEELAQMADARLWKLLHKAWQADQASQGEAQAKAHLVRPAVTVGGAGAGSGGVRDELATKEWMRRRNEQMTRGR